MQDCSDAHYLLDFQRLAPDDALVTITDQRDGSVVTALEGCAAAWLLDQVRPVPCCGTVGRICCDRWRMTHLLCIGRAVRQLQMSLVEADLEQPDARLSA
ncbi:MAG: hypothetical protein AAF515_03475 [Pseudomonadota bacterium]